MRISILCVQGLGTCEQHRHLLDAFDGLIPGGLLDLVDERDPQHLFMQLAVARAGQFDWRYLEQGPTQWRVRLERIAPAQVRPYQDSCPCRLARGS